LWETALVWEHWVERYRARGFTVIARSWPGMDGKTVAELRADTSSYANLGIQEIADFYSGLAAALPDRPIIMGHSFGGAIAEILLDRGFGRAGVAISPAPLEGVYLLPFSTLRSGFPVRRHPSSHRAVMPSADEFRYAFAITMTEADSQQLYDRYAVPAPGHVLFQTAFANFAPHVAAHVKYHNPDRAPLLLVGGTADRAVPAKLQHESRAITAYKQFDDRDHATLLQSGWEAVADFALEWALSPSRPAD
jgi:pimeloyl-ACP methyl ester carboxylesterase